MPPTAPPVVVESVCLALARVFSRQTCGRRNLGCAPNLCISQIKYEKARAGRSPSSETASPVPQTTPDPYAFEWSCTDEPHATRRRAILAKYGPQVRALYGPDHTVKWRVATCVVSQLVLAYFASTMPWYGIVVLAYCAGGIINHSLSLALHETSHNLAFRAFTPNKWFGMIANLPLGIPVFS